LTLKQPTSRIDGPALLLDVAFMAAWFVAGALTSAMRNSPHPAWALVPLLAYGLLIGATIRLREMGTVRASRRGLGAMTVRLFVSLWALLLAFISVAWMTDVAGVSGYSAPHRGTGWATPLTFGLLAAGMVYPVVLIKSVLKSSGASRWADNRAATATVRLNALATNVHVVLAGSWAEQSIAGRSGNATEAAVQLACLLLILAVPRFALLTFRYRRQDVWSLLLVVAAGIVEATLF
jgi:hypothetical protein